MQGQFFPRLRGRIRALASSSSSSKAHQGGVLGGDALLVGGVSLGLLAVLGEAYFRTELGDAEAPSECEYLTTNELLKARHVRTLERDGIVVIPYALDPAALKAARQDLFRFVSSDDNDEHSKDDSSEDKNTMEPTTNDADVRQDRVAWVQTGPPSLDQKNHTDGGNINDTKLFHIEHCIRLIRGVTHALMEHNYCSDPSEEKTSQPEQGKKKLPRPNYWVPKKCQLAWYPGDGMALYRRHLDKCHNSIWELGLLEWLRLGDYRARSVTVILYLNQADRPKSDGGALRCWVMYGQSDKQHLVLSNTNNKEEVGPNDRRDTQSYYAPFDVQPTGGTMVIFQSDKVEHMVLPSTADRYAMTSWVHQV